MPEDNESTAVALITKEKAVPNVVNYEVNSNYPITYYPEPICLASMSKEEQEKIFAGACYMYIEFIVHDSKVDCVVHASTTSRNGKIFRSAMTAYSNKVEIDPLRSGIRKGLELQKEILSSFPGLNLE